MWHGAPNNKGQKPHQETGIWSNARIATGADVPVLHHSCLSRAGTRCKVALGLGPLRHSPVLLRGHGPRWATRCVCECECGCGRACLCCIISTLTLLGILPAGPTPPAFCLSCCLSTSQTLAQRSPLRKWKYKPQTQYLQIIYSYPEYRKNFQNSGMRKMTQVFKWAEDSNKVFAQVGLWVANKHVERWSPHWH